MKRVAMEYSPGNSIPYISRVDARHDRGGARRSASKSCRRATWCSGSRPSGPPRRWPRTATASDALYRIKDRAFDVRPRRAWRPASPLTEFDVQQAMMAWFDEEGLICERYPQRRRRRRTPATRTTALRGRRIGAIGAGRGAAARPLGQAAACRARCLLTSPGSASPADGAGRVRPGFRGGARRPRRRGRRWCSRRARPDVSCAASRSTVRAAPSSNRRGTGPQFIHRTGHSLGEKSTATACTWTITRPTTSAG